MKSYRRKKIYEVTRDPITGQDRILGLTQYEHFRSDQGSIDTEGLSRKYIRDCGCDKNVGGRCRECGAISCITCHGRCQSCQKPICLEHSNYLHVEGQEKIRLCRRCHDSIVRKQRLAKVGRFFLSLLTEGEGDE